MTPAQAIIDVFENEGDRPSAQAEQDFLLADVKVRAREPITVAVNSLSPLQNVFVSSSSGSAPTVLAAVRAALTLQFLGDPAQAELLVLLDITPRVRYQPGRLFIDTAEDLKLENLFIGAIGFDVRPGIHQGCGSNRAQSPVHLVAGVDILARQMGVSSEVATIADLCLRVIPEVDSVLVTVVRDEEDGVEGLHFEALTRSEVGPVLDSEARLHEQLFESLSPSKRQFFTIGYRFAR